MTRKVPEGSILIYDIETTSHQIDKAELRFFGFHSYSYKQTEIWEIKDQTDVDKIKWLLDSHDYLIGFNNEKFDNMVLQKYGIECRGRNVIDLWNILAPRSGGGKGRHAIIKGFNPPNYKLGTIVKELGLGKKKNETFDYKILTKKEPYTASELAHIIDYTKEDILITRNLFEYLYNYFFSFQEYMKEEDVKRYKWLTTSVGAWAYKVICHLANIREEYADTQGAQKAYEGGFVALPTKEKVNGKIYCLDFASAYPHAFMMANLFSHDCKCCPEGLKYSGKGMFQLKGKYCVQNFGKIESVIKQLYQLRQHYKKLKDPREFTLKIVLNTMYGISGSPIFKTLYNINTASDCTYIVREMIKYARQKYLDAGYEVLYSDTDSVYLKDPFENEIKLMKTKDEIVKHIKSCFPFPQETFNMGIDAKIKAIFFFKTNDEFIKKNYMYITDDDKITIKGLPLVKSNASALSRLIFYKYLKEQILKRLDCKFSSGFIKQLIYEELEQNILLAGQSYKVKSPESYKVKTSLPFKIAEYMEEQFKSGILQEKPDTVILIPNNTIELGRKLTPEEKKKHKKGYCILEDFKKNKLPIQSINIEKALSELNPFIKEEQTKLEV